MSRDLSRRVGRLEAASPAPEADRAPLDLSPLTREERARLRSLLDVRSRRWLVPPAEMSDGELEFVEGVLLRVGEEQPS